MSQEFPITRPLDAREDAPYEGVGLENHHKIIDEWLSEAVKIPEIKLIWLEGSLVYNTATPGSDIDLQIAIEDDAYDRLWGNLQGKLRVLEGFGEYYPMGDGKFVRIMSKYGIIIELNAHRVSELAGLKFYISWKFLHCTLPEGPPEFGQRSTDLAFCYPPNRPLSPEVVKKLTLEAMFEQAYITSPFYHNEYESIIVCLDKARNLLLRILYRRAGIRFAKRYKHLYSVLPEDHLADFRQSFVEVSEGDQDKANLAAACMRTITQIGKHLQALGEEAGGGFDKKWYNRLLAINEERFKEFQ